MSDFAGLWRLDGKPVLAEDLERMATGLEGRNARPPRFWHDGPVGMAHRQHVFTPEDQAERMPRSSLSGRVLAADCRLNDRAALLSALELPNRDTPDGTIILAAFERWGIDCASRLWGDYAVALWDPADRRFVLLRDPAGNRTLYLHRTDRIVAFSTRLRALLALPEVPRDLDDQGLADHLVLNVGSPTRTMYRAITRVPMAHFAIVTAAGTHLARHWSPPEPGSLRRQSDRAYEEEGRHVLDQAVGDALRSRGPVTQLLTAGLDSAAIVESATRQLAPARHLAVTRVPDGPVPPATPQRYHNETPFVRLLADQFPTLDWHCVSDAQGEDEYDSPRGALMGGKPSRAPQNIAWFNPVYRLMARHGSEVTLGGEWGNVYFSSSGLEFLPSMLTSLRWGTLAREIRALSRASGRSLWSVTKGHVLRPFEPLDRRLRRSQPWPEPWGRHSAINPGFVAETRLDQTLDLSRYRMRVGGGHRSVMARRAWMCEDEIARDEGGGIRAMTGIDRRLPLADRRVVEFFGALPPEQFLRRGETRSIARRLLRGRLPAAIVESPARGMQNGDWFHIVTAQRPAMLADIERLRARPLASRVVDLNRLQSLLENWPRDLTAAEQQRPQYLQMLTRGMEMARFLAWHEGGNT